MNERELGKELLGEDVGATDAAALTARILKRDRRRVWLLGAGCVVAWMAVVMLPWATTLPMLHKVILHEIGMNGQTPDAPRDTTEMLQVVKVAVTLTFLLSLATMFVAAVLTVALVVASRRATLRQVNARLAEISAMVRALGRTGAGR